jgi:hypothetical protein
MDVAIAGGLAGLLSESLTYPISTLKARQQVFAPQGQGSTLGFASGMLQIVRTEGVRKLYAGFGAVLTCAAPARGAYFLGYELTKQALGDNTMVHFLAGTCAQLSGSLLWVPQDVVKERLQVQAAKGELRGSIHAFRTILQQEGARGLFRGYFTHQIVWSIYNSFYFAFYEKLKGAWIRSLATDPTSDSSTTLPSGAFPICAALAATAASIATAPLDLVKTRLQTQGNQQLYSSSIDCFKKVVRHGGVAALFNGVAARCIFLSLNHAITMSIFEHVRAMVAPTVASPALDSNRH